MRHIVGWAALAVAVLVFAAGLALHIKVALQERMNARRAWERFHGLR